MAGESKTTTDHNTIRKWVEERGGHPATVRGTGDRDEPGVLRIDFPGYRGKDRLEEISWDDAVDRIAKKLRKTRDESWIATEEVGGVQVPVNRTDAIAFMGGAQNTTEECYLFQKAMRLLGLVYVEHQARL